MIEDSPKIEVRSAEETYESLSVGEMSGLSVALLYGRMRSADKEEVMARFRRGATPTCWSQRP